MSRVSIAIILLFSTALILYWQVQSKKEDQARNIDISQRPDYIVEDLSGIEYNKLGQISSRVSAKHMEHFDNTNMTYFTQPVYLIYPDNRQGKWRIQAKKGTLNKITGKVTLENNVIIDSMSPDQPLRTVKTDFLELDLNTKIMTSNKHIYITGVDFTIEGKGLYADLNTQTVKLTSQVEGKYETK
ncbi:LPS export ABC transporter periplasmic protein LptC [uncultured Shewanella sp.]|uniref:LPS export ABC transporter periplasmic protein LptC n=1 Tax=uncultured Shewanella sp. TaxID=173975 RepID=UPI00260738D0|nr:LPS export ABC transporter periplasmic protein LptC [uncultured Shewanella sp.]